VSTVVIGAGVIGVTLAHELAMRGDSVTVLDERPGAADGTSFANGSLLTPSMSDPWASPGIVKTLVKYAGKETAPFLLRMGALPSMLSWGVSFLRNSSEQRWKDNTRAVWPLALLSRDVLEQKTRDLGLSYDLWEHGTLRIHEDAASMQAAEAGLAVYRELGCEIRKLDQAACLDLEPALRPVARGIHGAFQFPIDRSGDCRLFTRQLAEACKTQGVKFHFGCKVKGIAADGRRITGLTTAEGTLKADRYVLAAGSESLLLGRQIGLHLPVFPVKGYSATFDINGWNAAPHVPFVDNARKVAVVRMGNRLRVAGTAEFAGFNVTDNPVRSGMLLQHFKALFPESTGVGPPQYWHGLRPMTPDGRPLIGRTAYSNLFINTGHGALGWTLSCGSARLLAQLMSGETADLDLAPYGLHRA
jgi:D-amino-acid dehydrogenase